MKAIVAMLFILVLCVDFLAELNRKKLNLPELYIRAFMIIAAAYFLKSVPF